jgi:hypothetical protein
MALGREREVAVDDRGVALRASWHGEEGVVVLSLWRGPVCTATCRLPPAEAARMGSFLLATMTGTGEDASDAPGHDAGPHLGAGAA